MNRILPMLLILSLVSMGTILNGQAVNYDVLFHTGKEHFPENFKTASADLSVSPSETFGGYYFRMVQFYQLPNQSERRAIESKGLHFLGYVPHHAYIMAVPVGFNWLDLDETPIRSLMPLDSDWKTGEKLMAETAGNPSTERIEVLLTYPKIFSVDQIELICVSNGITVIESSRYDHIVKASLSINTIAEKAALPFVSFLEKTPPPATPDDDHGRALHRSNMIDTDYPSGYQFNGEGVNVLVRDDGVIGPHIDFNGRLDNSFVQSGEVGDHGTNVASTLGGAGNMDPYARGMADGAFIYGLDYEETFLDVTMDLYFNENVLITNSSYSNGCNDGYTSIAQTVDQQVYDNPDLSHVFSAGNSGNSNCGYGAGNAWGNITGGHKQGKNVIATANIDYDGTISGSSSKGPAEDGRIKPDLAAQGIVYAAEPGYTYINTTGTSFSAPSVAGVLAQLYQAYQTWNGGANPESALMKACLMNTANDLGNPGPDFTFGWGHLNAYKALKTIEENRYFSDEIDASEENEHILEIPAGIQELRVMVYWSDIPGSPMSNKALVNNLDMKLVGPTGDTFLPYVLDPTPNAATLGLPATNGVDDLNNVEQVRIDVPVAGTYTLLVNGTEVPMGAQKYYVLWEQTNDEITVTYPNGGECLTTTPEQSHTIHWDAYGDSGQFTIQYSLDSGTTWLGVATVDGNVRNYDFTGLNTYSGKALVRVSRDGVEDTSNATFSIMDPPENVQVMDACPTYLTLTWDTLPGATGYVVYRLGDKYMDSVGMTTNTTFDLPITNPTISNWYAVSSIGPDNACSPRTYAGNYSGGLMNCILNSDVSIEQGNVCSGVNYICDAFDEPLDIIVVNGGLTPQSDIEVSYSLNGGPVNTEIYAGPLNAGEALPYIFSTTLDPISGVNTLKTWVTASADEAVFNDTLTYSFEVEIYDIPAVPVTYVQDFNLSVMPPVDWKLNNPDNGITWNDDVVIGANGTMTGVAKVNNFNYNNQGQRDELLCVPLDLTTATDPMLSFDIAYARYSQNFSDTFFIEIATLCADECVNDLLYYKFGTELSTVGDQTSNWEPDNADEWRNELLDLSAYVGNEVLLKFVSSTGYGNGLFIDNINVFESVAPTADFQLIANDLCTFDVLIVPNSSTGAVVSYEWDFGADAVPATSFEYGPHEVYFETPGTKTISLTVSGPLGSDTFTEQVEIGTAPEVSYTFVEDGLEYQFTNTGTLGDTYLWDFGDNNSSIEENPTYVYMEEGEYDVVLEVTNNCGTVTYSETITAMVTSTIEGLDHFSFDLSPNPGTDAVTVLMEDNQSRAFLLELYDARGQHLMTYNLQSRNGTEQHQISTSNLSAGAYWFKLVHGNGIKTKRWIKL